MFFFPLLNFSSVVHPNFLAFKVIYEIIGNTVFPLGNIYFTIKVED